MIGNGGGGTQHLHWFDLLKNLHTHTYFFTQKKPPQVWPKTIQKKQHDYQTQCNSTTRNHTKINACIQNET